MQPRRIILADGSRFLRDILRKVIDKTPGIEVVGEVSDLDRLPATLRQTDAEWILLSMSPNCQFPQDLKVAIMNEFPAIRILDFYTDGSQVKVERVGQHEVNFGGLTWDVLLNILRENPQADSETES